LDLACDLAAFQRPDAGWGIVHLAHPSEDVESHYRGILRQLKGRYEITACDVLPKEREAFKQAVRESVERSAFCVVPIGNDQSILSAGEEDWCALEFKIIAEMCHPEKRPVFVWHDTSVDSVEHPRVRLSPSSPKVICLAA
jgi:hypothetical protein